MCRSAVAGWIAPLAARWCGPVRPSRPVSFVPDPREPAADSRSGRRYFSKSGPPSEPARPPPGASPDSSYVSIRKPCSSASATPAAISVSRPSPWRIPANERGGRAGARRSNSEAMVMSVAIVTVVPASDSSLEHAAALRRAERGSGSDQPFERAGERYAQLLAPGRQQLLGHEWIAARSLRDQQERRRRGPRALDRLDQLGQLGPLQRRHLHARDRGRRGEGRERSPQRVRPEQPVGLVRGHEHDPLATSDAGKERDQATGRGIGVVQVLEQTRPRAAAPPVARAAPARPRTCAPRATPGRRCAADPAAAPDPPVVI